METEMKTRSIRADEKVLDRFVQLSKEFGNQSECLAQLVSTWELHNAANALPEMATDITDIEAHLQALQSAYLHILELSANADRRAGVAYKDKLESKDKIIADYQSRLTEAENALAEAKTTAETVQEKLVSIQDKLAAVEAENVRLRSESADKQIIIEEFRKRLPEAEEKEKLVAELQASEKEVENLNRQLEKAESERTKAVFEAKEKCRERYDTKADEMQKKIDEAVAENLQLTKENAQLQVALEKAIFKKQ